MPVSSKAADNHSHRYKVFLPASVRSGTHAGRIHILDLSCHGALIHCTVKPVPSPGTRIDIDMQEASRRAVVMRKKGNRIGVAFDVPFEPGQLNRMVETGVSRPAPRVTRPVVREPANDDPGGVAVAPTSPMPTAIFIQAT